MNNENQISRRRFLLYLLAVSGISFWAGSVWRSWDIEEALNKIGEPLNAQRLHDRLSEIEKSAKVIGEIFVQNSSEGYSKSELLAEINSMLDDQELEMGMIYGLEERLSSQIMSDFENSSFIEVENWLITRTEAQICGIFYLQESNS